MKVLERIVPVAIVTCSYCGSKLEIESSDVFWHKELDGDSAPAVTCAVCHHITDIEEHCKGIDSIIVHT